MGALQALIPLGIITAALGVGGNLLGWIPVLFHGEVCPPFQTLLSRLQLRCRRAARCREQAPLPARCACAACARPDRHPPPPTVSPFLPRQFHTSCRTLHSLAMFACVSLRPSPDCLLPSVARARRDGATSGTNGHTRYGNGTPPSKKSSNEPHVLMRSSKGPPPVDILSVRCRDT